MTMANPRPPQVPTVRCKFFVGFVYDEELDVEIGVNKFVNGSAQYYHRLGLIKRQTPGEMVGFLKIISGGFSQHSDLRKQENWFPG